MTHEKSKIILPTDNDGFVLLKCEYCGIYFKITEYDITDNSILGIFCPNCGIFVEDDIINYSELDNIVLTMIESLKMSIFTCCKRRAKIDLILKIIGCYCPFCGVQVYEAE